MNALGRLRPTPPTLTLTAGLIAILGLASLRIGFPSFDFRFGVFVLLSGWAVAAFGLAAWVRAPATNTGPLLVVTAASWYVGGFRWVGSDPLAALSDAFALVFAAVAAHALLDVAAGHHVTRWVRLVIAATYVAALLPIPAAETLVAAALLVGLGVAVVADRRDLRDRAMVIVAGVAFALALGGRRIVPSLVGAGGALDYRPLLPAALVLVAMTLYLVIVRRATRVTLVGDLVVELGSGPRPDLARGLGDLVGDPSLEVGFWLQDRDAWVDGAGRRMVEPVAGSARISTRVARGDIPVAILVHDPSVEIDPGIVAEVARAAELAGANARLQAEARAQVDDVRSSRRRLLVAVDDEREKQERRLREALDPRFAALERALREALPDDVAGSALEQLNETRSELTELVRGVHPMAADGLGLAGALEELARRAPVTVQVDITCDEAPSRASQTAILFMVSEALSNIAKHSRHRSAALRVARVGSTVIVEVTDDGRGGADPRRGSGLRGLRDRVEALGGRLTIDSPLGAGTSLRAELPVEEPA
ncbi:MAG: ATP-binding protein [Candidatus Limnocylindrales bacterium]